MFLCKQTEDRNGNEDRGPDDTSPVGDAFSSQFLVARYKGEAELS